MTDIATARTLLFVPGTRPERFAKAAASGADAVVLDLEDAVAAEDKAAARADVVAWLERGNAAVVRVNAAGTPWHDDDVRAVAGPASAVMVAKAERPDDLAAIGAPVLPLIETATGVLDARALCAVPGVVRVALGHIDLAAELGVAPDSREALLLSRSVLVVASAASGRAGPVDGVTTAFGDHDALRSDLAHALGLGFTGKLCIHPGQIAPAHAAMAPGADEVEWARGVLAAGASGSVAVYNGQMVDRPVLLRANGILRRAGG
ncbi:CoA ester lyase [Actinokineospora sp. PR83]|uniref:HpcH/HpaI aldolase/citrate lyase family protein n=1 Tax=Actinokineospora sp. PR83 TaxID=2884908 RepID=UPI0027E1D32A|nr:CoA ester lyase [Actinokineospora sp. PR83]MCG8915666.1 CoA ester lyase [Actinokineospora sp. PR83]